MGNKHLAEVLKAKDILDIPEKRICILAGVGAGKNYFVTNELAGHGNIFFVSSRRAKVDEMLLEEICEEKMDLNKFGNIFTTTNYGIELLVKNHRFSTNGIVNIREHFDIIVIDEFHSLEADATFANATFHVNAFLRYIEKECPNTKIIVMTGTPEPINFVLDRDKYKIFDRREDCINVIPKSIEVVYKKKAIDIMKNLPDREKTIYYTNSANAVAYEGQNKSPSLYENLCEDGVYTKHDITFAMTENKAKEIMQKAGKPIWVKGKKKKAEHKKEDNSIDKYEHLNQLNRKVMLLRKYIVSRKKLPKRTRILITTSTLKEGINIESTNIKIAFCESHLLTDIQQFAGRIRNGLNTLYVVNNAKQFDITEKQYKQFLLVFLFNKSLLEEINKFFNDYIKNENSILYNEKIGKYESKGIEVFDMWYTGDWSLYNVNDLVKIFIDYVEKQFPYVRYNHLESRFELFEAAFREQKRIFEYYKKGWEKAVRTFCKENNIGYVNNTDSKEIDTEYIKEELKKWLKKRLFEKEEKQELSSFFSDAFGLDSENPTPTTCNKLLLEYKIPFKVKTSNTQGKRYWEVIKN